MKKFSTDCHPKICAVDEVVTASDIDTLVLVFVGWFAFGGLVLAAIHFLLRNEISKWNFMSHTLIFPAHFVNLFQESTTTDLLRHL